MAKTRIGILGYGNLSRGVEAAVALAGDMELAAVFTRRNPEELAIATAGVPVFAASDLEKHAQDIDVLVLGGGSATDLPEQTPACAKLFNVVDSFDTHAHIPQHFAAVDAALRESGHVGVISAGWDPGLFSLARIIGNSMLPQGADYTFWGRGVSQGHSDAIRRIPGVVDARQYTVPVPEALEAVRAGEEPQLTDRQKHTRECYVVAEEGADLAAIEDAIVTMPNYFEPYDTTVNFITMEELQRDHSGIPHGGSVIRSGSTGNGDQRHTIEFSLKLDSNPEFTGSVLVAVARAVARMAAEGATGCKTIFDIAPAYYSPLSAEELRGHLL
ncbi:diaminopimelate dehydrogenase [Curtanaerobium respiraculi]|uniref:diaminopimelate dehydrogenase n=1 Tax=Curtanaerobium respiraculi TaxID=2949669 RepID=UPI0024B3BECA|nr:diaminopimelate dehydrogenase [Curtanaerobium respiraculi]